MIKIVHDHGMARDSPTVRQFVVHKGTVIFSCQLRGLFFQLLKIAPVSFLINGPIQGNQIGVLFLNIVQNRLTRWN